MALGEYGKYASMGISLVLTTAVYLFLGYRVGTWLDGRWGTGPTFMVVGVVLGMFLSLVSMVKELVMLTRESAAYKRDEEQEPSARDSEKNNIP